LGELNWWVLNLGGGLNLVVNLVVNWVNLLNCEFNLLVGLIELNLDCWIVGCWCWVIVEFELLNLIGVELVVNLNLNLVV
jgi:hypothetical protein